MHSRDNQKRSFYVKTFGCKVNQYESQAIREMLLNAGYREAQSRDTADIYIVNTCTVTEGADKEARYYINLLHRKNAGARIVVTGCLATGNADAVSSLSGVSLIVRNEDKPKLADILKERDSVSAPSGPPTAPACRHDILKITRFKDHTKAFLMIQDGCENFCAYCKVPYVRGALRSKPLADIIDEVRILSGNGFKEIILTGICLGAWAQQRGASAAVQGASGLADVLQTITRIPGDFRVRLSSVELKYVTDELVRCMAENTKICRHLHIPLQSGDDDILRRMNRPYTTGDFRRTVDMARKHIPGLALTMDVMVGFPGETDRNFRNTVECIKGINPLKAHIFTFSKREGTAAFRMGPIVPPEILRKRRAELEVAALDASFCYRQGLVRSVAQVLVESKRDRRTGLLAGYSDNYVRILFDGPDSLMKTIVPVTITDVTKHLTTGIYVP